MISAPTTENRNGGRMISAPTIRKELPMDKQIKTYIFGDPKIREKVHEEEFREKLRFAAYCLDRAMAFIGTVVVAAAFLAVAAW